MIQTAIGVPNGADSLPVYNDIINWMDEHKLQTYKPYMNVYAESANISVEHNLVTGGLNWVRKTIDYLVSLPYPPMVFHYGGYFYGYGGATTWRTMWWVVDGVKKTQDELTLEQLSNILLGNRLWMESQGIRKPWIFFDEPPHKSSDPLNPGKYGWNAEVEARIIKFHKACISAGFETGVAMPGPSQLRFWVSRINPSFWILNDAIDLSLYTELPPKHRFWLYNSINFEGLGKRIIDNDGEGYLQWAAIPTTKQNKIPSLFTIENDVFTPTDSVYQLIDELNYVKSPTIPEIDKEKIRATIEIVKTDLTSIKLNIEAIDKNLITLSKMLG